MPHPWVEMGMNRKTTYRTGEAVYRINARTATRTNDGDTRHLVSYRAEKRYRAFLAIWKWRPVDWGDWRATKAEARLDAARDAYRAEGTRSPIILDDN